jgi:hypothetical protein
VALSQPWVAGRRWVGLEGDCRSTSTAGGGQAVGGARGAGAVKEEGV